MKEFKIYVWSLAVVILSLFLLSPSHHDLARNPKNIEKIVKIDLPDIAHCESEDNMDRGASRWDAYIHRYKFKEEISEDCINELENRCLTDREHWRAEQDYYIYEDSDASGDLYYINCWIKKDRCALTYEIDEMEGSLLCFVWFLFILVNVYGLVVVILKFRSKKA